METITTDVLVVGAGPAGLTASALLARAGVPALTVTKYDTANSPRAHITNQRTVEVFRDLGIEDRVMARALPHHLMGKQVFATAFAGRELSRMMTWGTGHDRIGEYRAASPTEMCNAPQHVLEPILLDRARELGADVRLHHEVVAIRQDDEAVTARVRRRNTGEHLEVVARYAIGCDGAKGIVAAEGGFDLEGEAGFGNAVTVWIEADLTRYTRHRSGALFVVCAPGSDDVVSIWTCIEPWNEWSTIFVRHGMGPQDLSEEAVLPRVRAAIGDDAVEVRIKHISPWEFNHVVASHYRRGRLFVAGDAAHRHPPANGLGSNTSVQDAYNLAWKLALVVQGRAGESLLDTYDAERQPVGRQVVDRANRSVGEMAAWLGPLGLRGGQTVAEAEAELAATFGPDGEDRRAQLLHGLDVMNAQFNAHGVELGQRYESSAVVADGTPAPTPQRDPELHHQPSTHPGSPLPHVWLGLGTQDVSTLDLCDYGRFTLVTGADGAAWTEAATAVSERFGVEVRPFSVALGQEHNDVYGHWTARREVTDRGCVLIRPDRFVAWRSHDRPDDPTAALAAAMGQVLHRRTDSTTEPREHREHRPPDRSELHLGSRPPGVRP
ncbi:MAG: FAD-dependent monooxygenase [Actinobacteria bacterium]|nr:FAD-dependent monooxygenase [Actinomycetota bacterium]